MHGQSQTDSEFLLQGSVMHISSEAWLRPDTVLNNILFDLPLVGTKLDKVIKGCSLREDLDQLPLGEETKCGDQVGPVCKYNAEDLFSRSFVFMQQNKHTFIHVSSTRVSSFLQAMSFVSAMYSECCHQTKNQPGQSTIPRKRHLSTR